jgi:hypothetical protein
MPSRCQVRPESVGQSDTIASRTDVLQPILAGAGVVLVVLAGWLDLNGLGLAAERTAAPFLTLAVVIAAGAIAERFGVFRLLARVVLSDKLPSLVAVVSVLTFTAVVGGAINLDVAAVVAPPLAIRVAARKGLSSARLVVSTALTARAAQAGRSQRIKAAGGPARLATTLPEDEIPIEVHRFSRTSSAR